MLPVLCNPVSSLWLCVSAQFLRHSPAIPHWETEREAESIVGPSCTGPQELTWSRCAREPPQQGLNSQLEVLNSPEPHPADALSIHLEATHTQRAADALTQKTQERYVKTLPLIVRAALPVCVCTQKSNFSMCVQWFMSGMCCYRD